MNAFPNGRQIQRWFPDRWSEIAGNIQLVSMWLNFIRNGPCNALVTGPTRSGKTRTINLGIRSLLCTARTESLDPCGNCPTCKAVGEGRFDHAGVFKSLAGSEYSFFPIDCGTVSSDELESVLQDANFGGDRSLIYLDEVAALSSRRLEGRLLKQIDESQATWIASAISVKRRKGKRKGEWKEPLSLPMRGRFGIKVGTSLPNPSDLYRWIEGRSEAWRITILEPEKTIPLMIERTGCQVAFVIHIFAQAATTTERTIRIEDVQGFNFDAFD